jgi:hypothetical protein
MSLAEIKLFKKSPVTYLQNNIVDIPYMIDSLVTNKLAADYKAADRVEQGVHCFDLDKDPAKNVVRLVHITQSKSDAAQKAGALQAYWLPWKSEGTASVSYEVLNKLKVEYLFTSALGGCRILMTKDGFHHIAGNKVTMGTDPVGSAWRQEQSQQILAAEQVTRGRAFSSATGNKYGRTAFIVGYKTGFFRTGWHFVALSFDLEEPAAGKFLEAGTGKYARGTLYQGNEFYAM